MLVSGTTPKNDAWEGIASMKKARYLASAVQIGFHQYWMLGGRDQDHRNLQSTEMIKNGVFHNGPDSQDTSAFGCAVKVNSSYIFVGKQYIF